MMDFAVMFITAFIETAVCIFYYDSFMEYKGNIDEIPKTHTLNIQKFLPFLMKSTRLMCSIPLRF